ncbi:metallophosphoesterase, partial [Vibrio cholerae]|nr:metallophosphoesterase [Vibrio cholerae]
KEFNYLEERGFLKLKVHLGDWIDGSDPGLVDEQELINLRNCFSSKRIDYALIKGNHDENDKFDALHEMLPSFPESEFEDI